MKGCSLPLGYSSYPGSHCQAESTVLRFAITTTSCLHCNCLPSNGSWQLIPVGRPPNSTCWWVQGISMVRQDAHACRMSTSHQQIARGELQCCTNLKSPWSAMSSHVPQAFMLKFKDACAMHCHVQTHNHRHRNINTSQKADWPRFDSERQRLQCE